jgi:hypothetical protein
MQALDLKSRRRGLSFLPEWNAATGSAYGNSTEFENYKLKEKRIPEHNIIHSLKRDTHF